MHTIWILPGRFGLSFGPQQTGSMNEYSVLQVGKTILRRTWNMVVKWQQRSRQRTHLSEMSISMLKDIGLTPDMVRQETAKRFWEK